MLFGFFIFVLGCAMGSFLNCAVLRMESGKNFVKGSSFCPKCNHKLSWPDLVPVISFLFLKAKCRYCQKKISPRYLLIEIATGILFFCFYSLAGISLELVYLLLVAVLLEMIFVYDLKNFIIPDSFVFLALGIVFICLIFQGLAMESGGGVFFLNHFLSGAGAFAFFFFLWFVSRGKWMGFGDVKLVFLMGFFLGWPKIFPALFFAFVSGSIAGMALIAFKKKKMKSEVPFGPFLVSGTFFALFFGEKILNWYLSLVI